VKADTVRRWAFAVAFVVGAATAAATALGFATLAARWEQDAPRRVVAALPGVGAGWLDTLERVAGRVEIDTLTDVIEDSYHGALGGLYEGWYQRVRLSTDMSVYFRLLVGFCAQGRQENHQWSYTHPPEIANPAAVMAHEVGHHFQAMLTDSGPEPQEWRGWQGELFADRFARTMLVIRGWLPEDPNDALLLHVLSYRLRRSYWEEQ
jgi:hypothetical protein